MIVYQVLGRGAGRIAGSIAVPAGIWCAGRAGAFLAFFGAAVPFLPIFVFLPKLVRQGMKADTGVVIDAFGKNGQVKNVFRALFTAMPGLIMTPVIDPVMARQVIVILAGAGGNIYFS